jgi:hypothetical protein
MCKVISLFEEKSPEGFFCAGLYLNQESSTILVVNDFDTHTSSKKIKLPGGRSDTYVHYDQSFLKTLFELMTFYNYEGRQKGMISDHFRGLDLDPRERGMIIEFLEETGYIPVKWQKQVCHNKFPDAKNANNIFHQYYFWVEKILSADSTSIDDFIEPVEEPSFTAYEKSIRGKLNISVDDVCQQLVNNHSNAVKCLFNNQYSDRAFFNKYFGKL